MARRLTLAEAKAQVRAFGFSLKSPERGEYVLTPWGEREGARSYHTNDLEDAVSTARSYPAACTQHEDCAKNRALGQACMARRMAHLQKGRAAGSSPKGSRDRGSERRSEQSSRAPDRRLQEAQAFGFAAGRERLLQGGRGNYEHGLTSLERAGGDAWDRAYLAGYRRAGGPSLKNPHGRYGGDAGVPTVRLRAPRARW